MGNRLVVSDSAARNHVCGLVQMIHGVWAGPFGRVNSETDGPYEEQHDDGELLKRRQGAFLSLPSDGRGPPSEQGCQFSPAEPQCTALMPQERGWRASGSWKEKKARIVQQGDGEREQQKTGERVQGGWRSLFDTRNYVEGDLIL